MKNHPPTLLLNLPSLHKTCPYWELFWSVFSPNAGKYGSEKFRIRTLHAVYFTDKIARNQYEAQHFSSNTIVPQPVSSQCFTFLPRENVRKPNACFLQVSKRSKIGTQAQNGLSGWTFYLNTNNNKELFCKYIENSSIVYLTQPNYCLPTNLTYYLENIPNFNLL